MKVNGTAVIQFGEIDKAHSILRELPIDHPLAPLAQGFHHMLDGDYAACLDVFSEAIEQNEQAPPFVYNIAADVALLAEEYEKAREFILRRSPILASDSALQFDRFTASDVVKLGFIHLQNGDRTRGIELLTAALPVVQSLPRLGMFGQGVRDVQIFALLGRSEDALLALRAAVDAGYRGSIPYDNWLLADDPYLDSIRNDSRFDGILSEIEAFIAAMRARGHGSRRKRRMGVITGARGFVIVQHPAGNLPILERPCASRANEQHGGD